MKKVRFETSGTADQFGMSESECHSPRPFIERRTSAEPFYDFPRVLPYSNDPVVRYESSNSSPYPSVNKTCTGFPEQEPCWKPSDDLDLSLLDASGHEPRQTYLKSTFENRLCGINDGNDLERNTKKLHVLSSIENNTGVPPNVLVKDSSFFIRRDNLDNYHMKSIVNPLHNQFNHLNTGKENNPLFRKAEIMKNGTFQQLPAPSNHCHIEPTTIKPIIKTNYQVEPPMGRKTVQENYCRCHHCVKTVENIPLNSPLLPKDTQGYSIPLALKQGQMPAGSNISGISGHNNCPCSQQPKPCPHCIEPRHVQQDFHQSCACQRPVPQNAVETCALQRPVPRNAVDKKTWTMEKFEQRKQSECMEVEKQTNVSKEKREPTVADLFKIIKLQNEQLQLLQDKVDKFISASQQTTPTISCSTEHVSVTENDQLKMSIGVMTSFEIRTSTIINKEVMTQAVENAQIQCNRSQISIKEVVSKPANLNFLDGITPVNNLQKNMKQQTENGTDKTLNELSLYNVQVDNATTPNLSPEQTLYLDVRDYSESDASSNDQSNVGWTYYNKVMTHVNGMLHDSEMPSSASAMFRNMRQQCVQMQIDKSNISVTKRVKFGDDPLGIHQPHLYASTDTSLKMNQLAAKYLKTAPPSPPPPPAPLRVVQKSTAPIDMSFATRNYMERHKLLQGIPSSSKLAQAGEIPTFLDITALKQQPKFL